MSESIPVVDEKSYFIGQEEVQPEQLPPYATYECINKYQGNLLYAESYSGGQLSAIESPGDDEHAEEIAIAIAKIAKFNGADIDLESGAMVNVYVDSTEFAEQLGLEDKDNLSLKKQFYVTVTDEGETATAPNPITAYEGSFFKLEPIPHLSNRFRFNSEKQLTTIEYPLFSLSDGMVTEFEAFSEFTEVGEQIMVSNLEDDSKEQLKENALYFPPVNEEVVNSVSQYFRGEHIVATDTEQNPIPHEEAATMEESLLVSLNDDGKILAVDHLEQNTICFSEVYDVPLEQHWNVFHGYTRFLHERIALIAGSGSLKASNYIHVYAPISTESRGEIILNEGEYRVNVSTFHLNGNFITHECNVFSADHEPLRRYSLSSPTDLSKGYDFSEGN